MLNIADVTIRKTKIPVFELVQEAVDLKTIIRHDKEILVKRGLDWKLVEDLDDKADKLSRPEARWVCTKADGKSLTINLKALAGECKTVRSQISISLRRLSALYDLGFRVPAYSQKNRYADIVQDLYDMWYVCNNKRELLTNLGFDMSVPDKAFELHLKLSKAIAFTVNERPHLSPDRDERNSLRDELFSIVSTIMDFAKMVFTGDPQKYQKYVFSYYCTANRKRSLRLRITKKILLSKMDS